MADTFKKTRPGIKRGNTQCAGRQKRPFARRAGKQGLDCNVQVFHSPGLHNERNTTPVLQTDAAGGFESRPLRYIPCLVQRNP